MMIGTCSRQEGGQKNIHFFSENHQGKYYLEERKLGKKKTETKCILINVWGCELY
jgi:hypothetical protein